MKTCIFTNEKKNLHLSVSTADTFWTRFRGLMFRRPLAPSEGLLITPCSSIHMCFMRFAIDAVYLDQNGRILKITRNLRPWLGISACWRAKSVLEINAGEAERLGLAAGQQLRRC